MSRIVFRMLAQMGHHNATFKLAQELKDQGHIIIYAANRQFKASCEQNGFNFFEIDRSNDIAVFKAIDKRRRKFVRIKALIENKLFDENPDKDYFEDLIRKTQPDLIILDAHLKAWGLQIIPYKIPVFTIQTHVSNTSDELPPYDCFHIPNSSFYSRFLVWIYWRSYYLRRLNPHIKRFVKRWTKKVDYSLDKIDFNQHTYFGFKYIPEINTSPFEFDFPHQRKRNYHYFKSIPLFKRKEEPKDYNFEKVKQLLDESSGKIVLCAFGSLPWLYPKHQNLIRKLIKIFDSFLPRHHLLVSIDDTTLRRKLRSFKVSNVHIFNTIPQIEVLENYADVMINHGGINSILECINTCTPMLVYPGSKMSDQIGNAARVEYHQLGLKGYSSDSLEVIKNCLLDLLENNLYMKKLKKMNMSIKKSTEYSDINELIRKYISIAETVPESVN